ncbi:hypothetical protein AQUCO_01700441v1 [Aquilegia coerulea]|uniref:Phytocyanin domain-containing protein n=1 Tax=Aquilegia coerulea TaxID=218851 RepID=A0A2G5DMX9_AQUCA|nr:hypothetical protein AQUCO_01700441v1 [Aquilegia coerulea]
MAFVKRLALVFFMVIANLQVSKGVVYKVGDSSGWTIPGNVDYKKWAASKTFHIGDTIVFEYDVNQQNVVQVSYQNYTTCDVPKTPLASYKSGNDSITIKYYGHYYFVCGVPGHCKQGQKVDIRVPRPSPTAPIQPPSSSASPPASSPTPSSYPSSSPSPSPSPTMETLAPPAHNNAPLSSKSFLGITVMSLVMVLAF